MGDHNIKQKRKTQARKARQQRAWDNLYRDSVRKGRPAGYLAELRRISFYNIPLINKQRIGEVRGRLNHVLDTSHHLLERHSRTYRLRRQRVSVSVHQRARSQDGQTSQPRS